MKKTTLGLAVGAALILGCATSSSLQQPAASAQAAEGAQAEKAEAANTAEGQQAVAAAKPQPKRLICEEVATTGSHIKQRICRPAEVAEQEREEAQENVRRMRNINVRPGN